jgi:undecaprenyl-diphosphatase
MKKILILLPVLILLWLWLSGFLENFHTVIPNKFYRSAQMDAQTLAQYVTDHNIATVVNLRGANPKNEWYRQEKKIANILKINHVDIKLTALGLPKIHLIKQIIDAFQTQPKPILFHCKRGADRAGLASVITLLLQGQLKLSEIKEQVSWRYQAIADDSTGKLFLGQYSNWVDNSKLTHKPQIFLDWIDHNYQDDNGNMLSTFEQVNDIIVATSDDDLIPVVNIDRAKTQQLKISGWTIDYIGKTIAKDVKVLLSQSPAKQMRTKIPRPDVAKTYSDPGYTLSGWQAIEQVNDLANGCYDIQLVFTRMNNKTWTSPTKAKVCISS